MAKLAHMNRIVILAAALAFGLSLAAAGSAVADDTATTAPASGDPQLKPLCTDRPTKSTSPCTVDAGHFQLETDLFNATFDHSGGADTTTLLYTNPTLKWGVTNTLDVELNISPFETASIRDQSTGLTAHYSGVGDLYGRVKIELVGVNGGDVAFGLEPYVKAPTAPAGVGDQAVEGGLIAPISINLPANWSLVIDPEVDALKNAIGEGRHANVSGLFSFSYPVSKTLTASAELWGDVNADPSGTVRQISADLGAAWIPASMPNLQWDGGVNLGLNRSTPAVQAYVGVSRRF